MPLNKQSVFLNFAQGLDQKTDPLQIPTGKFASLQNAVFDKIGRLTKRNGYASLLSLPDGSNTYLTTFNGGLTAIGNSFQALSNGGGGWISKGTYQPIQLSTQALIRNNNNQTQADTVIASNGLACTAYADSIGSGGSTILQVKYSILDTVTGQNIYTSKGIDTTFDPGVFGKAVFGARPFILGNFFVVLFGANSASGFQLQYVPISIYNPSTYSSVSTLATNYSAGNIQSYDGVVSNNTLYVSYNGSAVGLQGVTLNSGLIKSSVVTLSSVSATRVSMTADNTGSTPVIWTSWSDISTDKTYVIATNQVTGSASALTTIFSTKTVTGSAAGNIALTAQNNVATIFYEQGNNLPYDATISSDLTQLKTVSIAGSVSALATVARSLGIASKAFLMNSQSYFLGTYSSQYQSTYFLVSTTGMVLAKLAYGNAPTGYSGIGLPQVNVSGNQASIAYLNRDQITAVNKGTDINSATVQTAGVYFQTGVNLVNFKYTTQNINSVETANNLHLNGGLVTMYDGVKPVEHGFHVYPDNVEVTTAGNVGSMSNQKYFYAATYSWTDNQGNVHRSAPSLPTTLTTGSGTTAVTVSVPTLRLTQKIASPVKINIYRWSSAQQIYYAVTNVASPVLNDTTVDAIQFKDYFTDAAILGNEILYTNGGVLENIAAPSCLASTLFDSRMWIIDAEDPNLLWYSKQVIETTPVEFSDQLTLFVSPNSAAQGATGPMTAISAMDEKLIVFKKNAIFYINGVGPDNTGANSQYSDPIFITSTVGCTNQSSLVMTPNGLMFQSDKGIWLLGRDLSTSYIGKDVEDFNVFTVVSANAIPATNQVRFTLSNGQTLMYDYLVGQWGSFVGNNGISSTLYQNLHTYIDQYGSAFQESAGSYLDGSRPVLMAFTTGWLSLAGLQGYQRAYRCFMLGEYKTPHRLTMGVAFDYDSNVQQLASIVPDNFTGTWGSGTSWGSISTWGGNSTREQWQVNFIRQTCQSFQLSLQEYYDPTIGIAAGAGLTLSGLNIVFGSKKSYPRNISATHMTS